MSTKQHIPTNTNHQHKANGLRIGHANVYHVHNKVHDVCMLLKNPECVHILGLAETRLATHIRDEALAIPSYTFLRKDGTRFGQTGMGIYVHDSVLASVKRRDDLESENVECMWLEYRHSSTSPMILIGFVYRNPASGYSWYDDFVHMMDGIQKLKTNVILLGDFNIDILKQTPVSWELTLSLFNLHQMVSRPTRITPSSSTLLDHIYTNNAQMVSDVTVVDSGISDHCPIMCTWLSKTPKQRKNSHTTIQFRSFKHFNQNLFFT